jgi:hypothetical protein
MRSLLLLLSFCAASTLFAQKEALPKFGKIDPNIFTQKAYAVDSSAPAVALIDLGKTEIVGNHKGWFSMRHTHRKRVHILNKNGYDYASFSVLINKDRQRETSLQSLKCFTYNLEGDKVVETKLEKSGMFEEQLDKNLVRIRCTAPAVKEGSVVEYEYTTESENYFSLVPWEFQGAIPRLWSEYQFSLPQFMDYIFLTQGYFPFHIKESKDRTTRYTVISGDINTKTTSLTCNVTDYRWVMKNVPVLKEEKFTSTIDNHIAKIEFQLAGYKDPLEARSIMNDWPATIRELMERDDFGKLVNAANGWLHDYWKPLLKDATSEEEKAHRLFKYVRNHFTCTDSRALIASQSLRNIVKTTKGNVSDINLLLVALFRNAGFAANPVIMSTRENGYSNPVYPLINRYNYVVAEVIVNNRKVLLDASKPQMGFGKIPSYCYNGSARVLDAAATLVELLPDSLMEREVSFFNVSNASGKWMGRFSQVPGIYGSAVMRAEIKEKGQENFTKDLKSSLGTSVKLAAVTLDSLDNPEVAFKYTCDFEWNTDGEDLLYMNPVFKGRYAENPFKAATRLYPVEMPYAIDETYVAAIETPEGYELDEMPKSARMLMNEEGDASFDYLISNSKGITSMRMQLKINRTFFDPSEYDMLREFFNHVVAKQNEQLVFKKKQK